MSDIIISAENIGKRYLLNHQTKGGGYNKFSDTLIHAAKAPLRWLRPSTLDSQLSTQQEDFWALKDVSFEIKRGEVVGIIGRNGAGKSTLLKILSRITEPTTGRITLRGRVASLLEVGTGFHPELTGRENIFLNGAILGMRREEIKAKFDEIVAFAEIEKFLDTPVKRYSSGMYVRLAFAVAAHLEPEILIVDEVLAVGDAQFQQKCLGKMNDVAAGGRTVLVVTHNMNIVSTLCGRALLMVGGQVNADGPVKLVLQSYTNAVESAHAISRSSPHHVDKSLAITALRCQPEVIPAGESLHIRVELLAAENLAIAELCILIYHVSGQRVAVLDLRQPTGPLLLQAKNASTWEIEIPSLGLVDGDYCIGIYCRTPESKGDHYDLARFSVAPGRTSCMTLPYPAQHRGFVELDFGFIRSHDETIFD